MNLTEFLKQYPANNSETFGKFVAHKREEFGYSIRKFAQKLGISAVYLCDIENGSRPVTSNMLPIFYNALMINPKEKELFMDIVHLSRKSWPEITEYITNKPSAREFIRISKELNLSNNDFNLLITYIQAKYNPNNSIQSSIQNNQEEQEK